jgi:hypothetical protein
MWYPRQRGNPPPPEETASPSHSQWGFRSASDKTVSDMQVNSVSLPVLSSTQPLSRTVPDFKSEKSLADPIGFLQETALGTVRDMQEDLAMKDIEIETLKMTLQQRRISTHEAALMMGIQVEPLQKDMLVQTQRCEDWQNRTSGKIEKAIKARETRAALQVKAEEEMVQEKEIHEEKMRREAAEQEERRKEVARERHERLRMLREDQLAADWRYKERADHEKHLYKRRKKWTDKQVARYGKEAEVLEKEAKELALTIDDCERMLAGQSDKAEILKRWKKIRKDYMLFYFRKKRNEASKSVHVLRKKLELRLRAPELMGKTAVERLSELRDEQDLRWREIQAAKHRVVARSMINEAVVRELIHDRETELQMLFRCTADDLQHELEVQKSEFAQVLVEKQPEARQAVQFILADHAKEMEALRAKLVHTYAVIEQDKQATADAQAAAAKMRKERDVHRDRMDTLKKKSTEQAKILLERETAVGYATLNEQLFEVKRMTTYLDEIGVDAPDLALQGFSVGSEEVRPSEQIAHREELTGLAPALRRLAQHPVGAEVPAGPTHPEVPTVYRANPTVTWSDQ